MSGPRLGSTYRLQLQGFGFRKAMHLVPYLSDLGIETLYLSPVLAAVPGSGHGYDVVDPTRVDPSLGTDEDLETLLSTLVAHGMRALLDIVPNHMAADPANPWWWDVLRAGRQSPFADVFDIDWTQHGGRVLVPVLDRPLSDVLATDGVIVDAQDGVIRVGDDAAFPMANPIPVRAPSAALAAQHYRPAYWPSGATEGNYRRFFDIGTLIGVRVEDAGVFERTHQHIRSLAGEPAVAGVRVDHIDGLADPAHYLQRLRTLLDDPESTVLVEKILGPDEALDPRWRVEGTTGYEFADHALALFVDADGSARLRALGSTLTNSGEPSFGAASLRAKREVLESSFPGDLDRLTRLTRAVLDRETPGHDLSSHDIRRAWIELTVHLDVYRTYLDGQGVVSVLDRARIERAATSARPDRSPAGGDNEVGRALEALVDGLLTPAGGESGWVDVAQRWQQLSGAVMAKGVEDTATYRYTGLSARCDVGSDPDATDSPGKFHDFAAEGMHGLNATSTHDSKRNEDARSRLAVLSEIDGEWASLVQQWRGRFVGDGGSSAPQPLEELRAYETLFALWPAGPDETASGAIVERATSYVVKAAREAKVNTSWTAPDESYERKVTSFIERLTEDSAFCSEMTSFSRSADPTALCNSLALVVLKTCCPGTPDFYQGTEYVEPVLTDPDNRRPVDFADRAASMAELPDPSEEVAARLLSAGLTGHLKLYVTRLLLHERRRRPELFERGSYHALSATTAHAFAFAREHDGERLLVVVPRLTHRSAKGAPPIGRGIWGNESLDLPEGWAGLFRDILSDGVVTAESGTLALQKVFSVLPVAVLRSAPDP